MPGNVIVSEYNINLDLRVAESVYLGLVVYLMWLLVFSRFIIRLNVTILSVVDVFIDNKESVMTSSIFISSAFQNSR